MKFSRHYWWTVHLTLFLSYVFLGVFELRGDHLGSGLAYAAIASFFVMHLIWNREANSKLQSEINATKNLMNEYVKPAIEEAERAEAKSRRIA
jgi:hypothetical protein